MYWMNRLFFALSLLLGFVMWSDSASAKPFSLFLEETVDSHDLVKAAEARRDSALARLSRARGEWLPHVGAVANIGPEHIDFAQDGVESTDETRDFQGLTAKQLVFDFGRSNAGIDRAREGVQRSEAELAAVRQEIMLQGLVAYLDVLRQTERLRLARESENRIIELTGIEETLVTKGAGLASDVLQAKSQLAGARAQLVRVQSQLTTARNRFRTIFGQEPTEALLSTLVRPGIPFESLPASLEMARSIAESESFELMIAGHNVEMARQDVAGARAGYFPELHLVGEAERMNNDQGVEGERNELRGMVELSWDIFSGGKTLAAVREARSALKDNEMRFDELRDRVAERVSEAWQELSSTRENAQLLRQQAEIIEEFLALARRERLLGTRSLLDVLSGEVGYLNALSNAVSAETDRAVAFYMLFHAMGRLDVSLMR